MPAACLTVLSTASWQKLAAAHRSRAREWTGPMRKRLARGEKHPVFDFLHTYYRLSLGKLETWHPGVGIALQDSPLARRTFPDRHYRFHDGLCTANPTPLGPKERKRLHFTANLLSATESRPPNFACHGLHEWAMVYHGAQIRHRETVPLRLPQEEIDALIESQPLCCSHFDAFRFFTPEAQPMNRFQPDLWSREQHEQPGCIHTNMDLYKWSAKAMPWIGSDLLWDCFQLALRARELDMRASPYDLSAFGYVPIPVETTAGRSEYEHAQRELCEEARPLRLRLLASLENVLAMTDHSRHHGADGNRVE